MCSLLEERRDSGVVAIGEIITTIENLSGRRPGEKKKNTRKSKEDSVLIPSPVRMNDSE